MNKENILDKENKSISKVLVVTMDEEGMQYGVDVANTFRDNNINTEMFLEDKKLKAKFKYADKLNIPYIIVIGEEEIQNKKVTLKSMITGEQKMLSLEEAIKEIG